MPRTEHDFLGSMELDDSVYYGIQTVRGLGLSGLTGRSIAQATPELVHFCAAIKKAAALANAEIGGLDNSVRDAIVRACDEVMAGRLADQFPTDVFTGGGGISINMNVNEVIANRANEIITGSKGSDAVHPNSHVNMCQSTNDVIPAAMLLAFRSLLLGLATETEALRQTFLAKADEFKDVCKLGRTCLQDALPMTLGQEFSGYAAFAGRHVSLLGAAADACLALPLGATAIGTGVGALPGYREGVYRHLRDITAWPLRPEENLFDALQNADGYVRLSAVVKSLAVGLGKIAADLRLLSSGPRGGFGEIRLPAVTPGSSIMPGKINPILPELMRQVSFQICGNDVAVSMAAENGELELNVWESVILRCLADSCMLLSRSIPLFRDKCVAGIDADAAVCLEQAEASTATAALVAAVFGYETGCDVAREAVDTGKKIVQVVIDRGMLGEQAARDLLNPANLIDGGAMERVVAETRRAIAEKNT